MSVCVILVKAPNEYRYILKTKDKKQIKFYNWTPRSLNSSSTRSTHFTSWHSNVYPPATPALLLNSSWVFIISTISLTSSQSWQSNFYPPAAPVLLLNHSWAFIISTISPPSSQFFTFRLPFSTRNIRFKQFCFLLKRPFYNFSDFWTFFLIFRTGLGPQMYNIGWLKLYWRYLSF